GGEVARQTRISPRPSRPLSLKVSRTRCDAARYAGARSVSFKALPAVNIRYDSGTEEEPVHHLGKLRPLRDDKGLADRGRGRKALPAFELPFSGANNVTHVARRPRC